jgi:hypothetical protein
MLLTQLTFALKHLTRGLVELFSDLASIVLNHPKIPVLLLLLSLLYFEKVFGLWSVAKHSKCSTTHPTRLLSDVTIEMVAMVAIGPLFWYQCLLSNHS